MARFRRKSRRLIVVPARNLFRVLTLVCVFALQWQAPIPWLHIHLEQPTLFAAERLAGHKVSFHASDRDDEAGWHLHFAMRDDILRGGGHPIPPNGHDDEDHYPCGLNQSVPNGESCGRDISRDARRSWHGVGWQVPILADDVCHHQTGHRQCLGEPGGSRSLLTTLGVARC